MANFTYLIKERVNINGQERGTTTEHTITGVNYSDSRIMLIPSGTVTEILNFAELPGAGTFVTGSVKYVRITNTSTGSINLEISASNAEIKHVVNGNGSFMVSTEQIPNITGSLEQGRILSIKASAVENPATINYFIVTS